MLCLITPMPRKYRVASLTQWKELLDGGVRKPTAGLYDANKIKIPPPLILKISILILTPNIKAVKDKKSLYRHGRAQSVPGG